MILRLVLLLAAMLAAAAPAVAQTFTLRFANEDRRVHLLAPPLARDGASALLILLHGRYGTGEWLEQPTHPDAAPPCLTSTDLAFAATASVGTGLAYLETNYFGGAGWQSAAVWIDGRLAMRPALVHASEARPPKLWPINGALRLLGVSASYARLADDEFTAFGLPAFRDHSAIHARGLAVSRT